MSEDSRERVMEAGEVVVAAVVESAEEEEETVAMVVVAAADRSHVHDARNGASRTTRSAITQVAPCSIPPASANASRRLLICTHAHMYVCVFLSLLPVSLEFCLPALSLRHCALLRRERIKK